LDRLKAKGQPVPAWNLGGGTALLIHTVVGRCEADLLGRNLHHVSHLKREIMARLTGISDEFMRKELRELDIADEWRSVADNCLDQVREAIGGISQTS
jgi:hypothetical protein